jgi:hypothetical protein
MKFPLSNIFGTTLLILASIPLAVAQTSNGGNDQALASDLRNVVILAGYPCTDVVEHSHPSPTEYHVSCTVDRHYRVRVSEAQEVLVESLSDPLAGAAPSEADHESFIKKKLFSIVNLAGRKCDEVLSYERRGPRDHLVICEDLTVYRVHVTPEGRLAVDEHPTDK